MPISKPLGRPSKYRPEMCEKVVDLMAKGYSKIMVAAELDIDQDTLHRWCKDEDKKDFYDAIKKGVSLSQAWWERQGLEALRDKDFSYTGWYMNMKNRFKWSDNQNVNVGGQEDNPIKFQPVSFKDAKDTQE